MKIIFEILKKNFEKERKIDWHTFFIRLMKNDYA